MLYSAYFLSLETKHIFVKLTNLDSDLYLLFSSVLLQY